MNKQSEALRIAALLDKSIITANASAELRRLHEVNAELVEALETYLMQDEIAEGYGAGVGGSVREQARAAIAKATGEQQ